MNAIFFVLPVFTNKDHSPVDCGACNSHVAEFFQCFKKQNTSVLLRQTFILLSAFKLQCKCNIVAASSETSDNSYQTAGHRSPDDLTLYGRRYWWWVTNYQMAQCLNFRQKR